MARGFSQKEEEDYDDIFALVALYTVIRSIVSLVVSQGWTLHQMEINAAFLHGMLQEEVYVEQTQRFEVEDRRNMLAG